MGPHGLSGCVTLILIENVKIELIVFVLIHRYPGIPGIKGQTGFRGEDVVSIK